MDDEGRGPARWDYAKMCLAMELKNPEKNPENLYPFGEDMPTPQRWLNCEPKDEEKARWRWKLTTQFRKDHNFDRILEIPHTKFELIRPHFNCFYYHRAQNGAPVWIDCPAGSDLEVMEKLGVSEGDLIFHYIWITEFLWKFISPGDLDRCLTIYNLEGLGVTTFKGKKKKVITRIMKLFGDHYPERTFKLYITNGPWWFNSMVWPVVKRLANKQTLDKIKNFSTPDKKFVAAISNEVDLNLIPPQFGGTCEVDMRASPVRIE